MGQRNGNPERERLEAQRAGREDWRLWGPYLAERAWGTVREDYSAEGDAWGHFSHDQARARAYRWSEDGLAGICDEGQRLCLALALWNGCDPFLKERAFGLTGPQGNHGEDVKEYYYYLEGTPSHAWLAYLYRYPQAEYPYARLVEENARRTRADPPFGLLDTGALDGGRYWDVEVHYAKAAPDRVHVRVTARNRGPAEATLHLLPTLWFRNTWSWGDDVVPPRLGAEDPPTGAAWAVAVDHPTLGRYHFYGSESATLLFTENESNAERLWGGRNRTPFVKDAFHRRVVDGESGAVNPVGRGTKCAAWSTWTVPAGAETRLDLVLSAHERERPFAEHDALFAARRAEADRFYEDLVPEASEEDRRILRQALAGMVWGKQFFHYDVARWLDGDVVQPPATRRRGRNHTWRHFKAGDVLSVPDTWEYPWFAAWDLAFHAAALALIDVDFAKDQMQCLLGERYLHPNGQAPAYEWAFGDVNPPVHAAGCLNVFRAERAQRGAGDFGFLERAFHKLLLNYAWWINRKDADGHNVFEGGFLGLDNISVYDRSRPLPPGYSLKQADATGWMAMFSLNMTVMALELATRNRNYEDVAIQCYGQFLAIANAMAGHGTDTISLWDPEAGFFKDLVVCPDGQTHRIDVYSWVGLIPLFAVEVVGPHLLAGAPRFRALLREHRGGMFQGNLICHCPEWENERGEHLLSLVSEKMLPKILKRLLDQEQFLSPYGVRSVSKAHATQRALGVIPGVGEAVIEYVPGESTSDLFGGNSNWRGPVWLPTNYALIESVEKFHRFLGDGFRVAIPGLGGRELTLGEVASLIAGRLVDLYRRGQDGRVPAMARESRFGDDPDWRDRYLFYEYFHGETGAGLGASHQTGWTGLLANLVLRRYAKEP